MYRRPAYAFGLVYDVFYCRCLTAVEHEVIKCKRAMFWFPWADHWWFRGTKRKITDRGNAVSKTTAIEFGREAFEYDPDWAIGGRKRQERNNVLRKTTVEGYERVDQCNLAAYLMVELSITYVDQALLISNIELWSKAMGDIPSTSLGNSSVPPRGGKILDQSIQVQRHRHQVRARMEHTDRSTHGCGSLQASRWTAPEQRSPQPIWSL